MGFLLLVKNMRLIRHKQRNDRTNGIKKSIEKSTKGRGVDDGIQS
jgi:hypothetical protein